MSNNKQSSVVDWIFSQLPDEYTTTRSGFDVYQQAKAMHKDETVKFTADWYFHGLLGGGLLVATSVENHYNEKFEVSDDQRDN
jgi:hypothetical protein